MCENAAGPGAIRVFGLMNSFDGFDIIISVWRISVWRPRRRLVALYRISQIVDVNPPSRISFRHNCVTTATRNMWLQIAAGILRLEMSAAVSLGLDCQPRPVVSSTAWHTLVADLDVEDFGQARPSGRRQLECTAARHAFEPSK